MHAIEISFVFCAGDGGRADEISEIVESESWHDGVQIHDADSLTADIIDHNVIDLGVIVSDSLGQITALVQIEQDVHHLLALHDPVDVLSAGRYSACGIIVYRFLKGVEPHPRVVEIWNGVPESRPRQVHQCLLESAEASSRFASQYRAVHVVMGAGTFDVDVGAPVVSGIVAVPQVSVPAGDQR